MEGQPTLSKLKCFSFISKKDEAKFKELKRLDEIKVQGLPNLKLRISLALVLQDLDKRNFQLDNLTGKNVYVSENQSQCFIKQSDFPKNVYQDQNEQSRLFLQSFKTILKEKFGTTYYEECNSFEEIIRQTDDRQEKWEELMKFLNDIYGISEPNLIYNNNEDVKVFKLKVDKISPLLKLYIPQGYKTEDIIIKIRTISENNQLESQCYEQLNDCDYICKLFCYIRTNKFEILFLEFYPQTLDQYLIQNKPDLFDLDLLRQLILAVKVMHERNIIHRDIKYQNVLMTTFGNAPLIKFIDFDISSRDDIEVRKFSILNKNKPPNCLDKHFKFEKEDDIWQLIKMVLDYQIFKLKNIENINIPQIEFYQDGQNYQMNDLFEYTYKMKGVNDRYRQLIYEGLQFCKDARPTIEELQEFISWI